MTLSGVTTMVWSELGSDGSNGTLCIPQSSSIIKASRSDGLVSYPGHSLGESYSYVKMQLVYSAALDNWAS